VDRIVIPLIEFRKGEGSDLYALNEAETVQRLVSGPDI